MFLTSATVSELQLLDLTLLVDMLSKQTKDYIQVLSEEGFTARTAAAKEALMNIQAAIESKKNAATLSFTTTPVVSSPVHVNSQGTPKIS